ncbi:MAG: hypothetical protein BGO01_20625 [Armatimonadetes bacterium 55-13]|nr:hypothetical protein [Armatimonadota bacterium]OJU64517.1 MAG: hypothetical protein BGO01_20625 [Armatimonadetes bacterium 55-13]
MPRTTRQEFELKDGTRLVIDSGQVTAFRPAQHVKPQAQGLIARIQNAFNRAFKRVDPTQTTEQGTSGTTSPSIAHLLNIQQRYDRWAVISDCRKMIDDDGRARRATKKFAREAVRKGATIMVDGESGMANQARAIADEVQEIVKPKLFSWAWMLIVEGDLFVQKIAGEGRLVDVKRMPAASMERLTDDTDEFIDPVKAFEQIDVLTQETVASFAQWVITHVKWDAIDGERYGQPEILTGRRHWDLLNLSEEAQSVRRMSRAAKQVLWNIGTEGSPGEAEHVKEFREINGKVEGRRDVFDPMDIALDIYGNGLVKAEVLEGDRNVHEVDDIRYAQNVYVSGDLPTPGPIFNLDSESINRDVVKDLREEWLKETQVLTEIIEAVVKDIFETALLLAGILPEFIDFTVRIPSGSIEKPQEVIDWVTKLRSAKPTPLISFQRAVQILAEFTDIDDPEEEMKRIEQEISDQREYEEKQQAAQIGRQQDLQLSKLSNGKAKPSPVN